MTSTVPFFVTHAAGWMCPLTSLAMRTGAASLSAAADGGGGLVSGCGRHSECQETSYEQQRTRVGGHGGRLRWGGEPPDCTLPSVFPKSTGTVRTPGVMLASVGPAEDSCPPEPIFPS